MAAPVPGAADSWYHEKESAWLYRAVAESESARRALIEKLAAAAEDQAAREELVIGGGAGLAAWGVGKLLGAGFA